MEGPKVVEHFFGVYLLYCMNPKFKGRTYIGYTVDPRRRIKQHNGENLGGAWKTSRKRPWNMVLVIHGFPSSTSALRFAETCKKHFSETSLKHFNFEWAWQHPSLSRRLRHVPKKKAKQKVFDYCLLVLSEMLKVGPWCRLPLTVRWLDNEFFDKYSSSVCPPLHMPISYGKVVSRSLNKKSPKKKRPELLAQADDDPTIMLCSLCHTYVSAEDKITCVKRDCHLMTHLMCLAKLFTNQKMLLPIDGDCPACNTNVLWGDLIRKKIGCDLHLDTVTKSVESEVSDDSSD